MLKKFAIWSYNSSLWGLFHKKASEDFKIGVVVGTNIGMAVMGLLVISAFWDGIMPNPLRELTRKRNQDVPEVIEWLPDLIERPITPEPSPVTPEPSSDLKERELERALVSFHSYIDSVLNIPGIPEWITDLIEKVYTYVEDKEYNLASIKLATLRNEIASKKEFYTTNYLVSTILERASLALTNADIQLSKINDIQANKIKETQALDNAAILAATANFHAAIDPVYLKCDIPQWIREDIDRISILVRRCSYGNASIKLEQLISKLDLIPVDTPSYENARQACKEAQTNLEIIRRLV